MVWGRGRCNENGRAGTYGMTSRDLARICLAEAGMEDVSKQLNWRLGELRRNKPNTH